MTVGISGAGLLLAAAASMTGSIAGAQGVGAPVPLRGRIVDARTALPLGDVAISLTSGRDTIARARSDSTGLFQAALPDSGRVVLHFARIGFHADSITAAPSELPLRVAMVPARATINTLAAMIVRDAAVASTDFEKRARRNAGGAFVRQTDIERRKPVHTSDLMRSLAGVTVGADSLGVVQVVSMRGFRPTMPSAHKVTIGDETVSMPSGSGVRCALRVAVNGRLMPPDFSVDDVRPTEILAIELYVGAATIPAEFSTVRSDAPCGIVMIWMKRGRRS